MRSDMAKVIVERPRYGSRQRGKPKGYLRSIQKQGWEGLAKCEGIKRRVMSNRKSLNEHLAPLRRYLEANVGRPWNKVFSEICENINRNSAVQDHIRDHVFDYVEVDVVLINGMPTRKHGHRWNGGRIEGRYAFYVCPETGLLREPKTAKQKTPSRQTEPAPVWIDESRVCRFMNGAWHLLEVHRFPSSVADGASRNLLMFRDKVLNRDLTGKEAIKIYGKAVYAFASRRLGRKEMKHLPIPIDWQK